MAGRHAQRPPRHRVAMLAAGVGLAVLAAGGVIWATADRTTGATTVASEVEASGVAAPAPASPAIDPDAPPPALVACADTLRRGDAVVAAADASRDHWGTHVQAQTDFDAGVISAQQTVDLWAATKAFGPADLAAFDAAKAEYGPVSSGCTGLDPNGVVERWRPLAAQCGQRAAEQAKALQAGDAVVADWRAHVQMMQNKAHTDPNAYGKMWRDMVNAAPPNLNQFAAARDALAQQPPCQLTAG